MPEAHLFPFDLYVGRVQKTNAVTAKRTHAKLGDECRLARFGIDRHARALWCELMAQFKPINPKSSLLRTHCQTSG
jgi:hypothetical protein